MRCGSARSARALAPRSSGGRARGCAAAAACCGSRRCARWRPTRTRALQLPLRRAGAALDASAMRTGDTPTAERARQDRRCPTALVTTPESLIADADARRRARASCAACTRWSSTNGTSCSATSAACRCSWRWRGCGAGTRRSWSGACRPRSATCDEAMHTLLGRTSGGCWCAAASTRRWSSTRCCPAEPGRFSWAGHLGAQMLPPVVDEIERSRHDAGLHQRALAGRDLVPAAAARRGPSGPAQIALHHGSLDKAARDWVELGLKDGHAEGGGRDLVARPRRRLPAGRAGAADRLAPRASRACCSAPAAAATRRAAPAA